MIAGVGAIEEGEHEGENVHLHFLALCRFAPRRELQHWLQARDCTIRKCHHPADDRCDDCKRDKLGGCHHPEVLPDGRLRPRCNGSWYVDVRQARKRDRDGRLVYGNGADAAAEVVKYACKPTMQVHKGFLTEGEWGRAYGFASDVLHVSNPMDPKALWLGTAREALDPIAKELDQWLEKTHELLVHHQVLLAGGEYCLFCSLRGPSGAPVVTLNRKVAG